MLNDSMTSFELIILFPLYINNWIGGSVEGRGEKCRVEYIRIK